MATPIKFPYKISSFDYRLKGKKISHEIKMEFEYLKHLSVFNRKYPEDIVVENQIKNKLQKIIIYLNLELLGEKEINGNLKNIYKLIC